MLENTKLAVCMPVFNSELTVLKAIESILTQTYQNFVFVITDDCSTDNTLDIIQALDDSRLVIRQNESNQHTVRTRNTMLKYCIEHGFKYMALMDADDVAYPYRLKKQIEILESEPSIAVCGSSMAVERSNGVWRGPKDIDATKVECIFRNPIPTPTAMIRISCMIDNSLNWRNDYMPCADHYLWYEMLFKYNLKARNTGDIDMYYTHSKEGISHKNGLSEQEKACARGKQELLSRIGIQRNFEDVLCFSRVGQRRSRCIDDGAPFLEIASAIKANVSLMNVDADYLDGYLRDLAAVYIGRTIDLPAGLKRDIIREFDVGLVYVHYRVEQYLHILKTKLLDRWFPGVSRVLTRLYSKVQNRFHS